jgi:hypothetical protein
MNDRLKIALAAATAALLTFGPLTVVARADSDVTASNDSGDVEGSSGDATATNSDSAFVGQHSGGGEADVSSSDVNNSGSASNVQEGDNDLDVDQTVNVKSGDVVGGQVIGGVSAGDLRIDATNSSEDVDLESGDAKGSNSAAAFVGLLNSSSTSVGAAADIFNAGSATNVQEGDNSGDIDQEQNVSTGDVVGGQVVGAVTSAGGAADLVLANTSTDADAESGDSRSDADQALFVGLAVSPNISV